MRNEKLLQRKFEVSVMRGPHSLSDRHKDNMAFLNKDIKLLKVALLYGDKVEFISQSSPYWNFLKNVDQPAALNLDAKRDFIKIILAEYSEKIQAINVGIRRESTYERESLVDVLGKSIEEGEGDLLNAVWPGIAEVFLKGHFFRQDIPELAVIERLMESNRLSFRDAFDIKTAPVADVSLRLSFTESLKGLSRAERENEQAKLARMEEDLTALFRWMDHVVAKSQKFPMLDDFTGTIANAVYQNPIPPAFMRAKAVPLAGRFFAKLEDFDKATLDQIIDVRRELDRYIGRFQNAVAAMATSLADIPDKDFDKEVERLWITEVQPELSEIDEKVNENKYLRELATSVFKDPKALLAPLAGGSVGFAVAHDALGLISGTLAAASPALGQSIWQYARQRDNVRRRKLFFLYSFERSFRDRRSR